MEVRYIHSIPSSARTLWKAFKTLPKKSGAAFPSIKYVLESVQADPSKLHAYNTLFGYTGDIVPSTYWHTRFFPIRILLAADKKFPFPLPGMVHLTDTITQYEPIKASDTLRMECYLGKCMRHEKGTAFETITQLFLHDKLVWEENTVNLRIGKTQLGEEEYSAYEFPLVESTKETELTIPRSMGKKYAHISGDFNPIHVSVLGAKIFGFKTSLMHGWYSLNKLLAPHQPLMDEKHTLFVAFKKPLFLPGNVVLKESATKDGFQFEVTDKKEGYPNLKGTIKSLTA